MAKLRLLSRLSLLLVTGCWLLVTFAHAVSDQAGTSGAAFLKLDQSVRAAALGGSFVALADDPSAIFYNAAGLQLTGYNQISFTQTKWLVDSSYSTLCYSRPYGLNSSLGFALSYLNFGTIQETTASGRTGTGRFFTPASILGTLSWARDVDWAYLGGSIKFIRQNIDTFQEDGVGFDLGILTRTPLSGSRLGVSILNLGGSGDKALSQTLLLGLSYETGFGAVILGDWRIPRDAPATLHLGVEYPLLSLLTLRGGFNSRSEEGSGGNFSLGLGFNFMNFNLDYAYVPYAELGDTHRAGMSLRF